MEEKEIVDNFSVTIGRWERIISFLFECLFKENYSVIEIRLIILIYISQFERYKIGGGGVT